MTWNARKGRSGMLRPFVIYIDFISQNVAGISHVCDEGGMKRLSMSTCVACIYAVLMNDAAQLCIRHRI